MSKKPSPAKPFNGDLAKSITADISTPFIEQVFSSPEWLFSRLAMLGRHYGIDLKEGDITENYMKLVISMALDFVPGFQVKYKAPKNTGGRPPFWIMERHFLLAVFVEKYIAEKTTANRTPSDGDAIAALIKREGTGNADTVQNQLILARKSPAVRALLSMPVEAQDSIAKELLLLMGGILSRKPPSP